MSFDEETIQQVWEKGAVAPPNDPNLWRKDAAKAWIYREKYGNRDSKFGWEIDHKDPGGGNDLSNLQPLQWQNNVSKQKGRLDPVVTSKGVENIELD
jgi:hypothetical protein